MLLLVDNGSVFTRDIAAFLEKWGGDYEMRKPGSVSLDSLGEYGSFILSGRRRNDRHTNRVNSAIIRHAMQGGSKLLGICYGAEILALALGGTLRRSRPAKGLCKVTMTRGNPLAAGVIEAYQSHTYEIARLPDCLEALGSSQDCRYEVIRHRTEPIFGTQFHPEMSGDGRGMLAKFCAL